jgi:hypothetical protein
MSSESDGLSEGLRSTSPNDRARAASWLIQHPHEIPTRDLMRALQAETVPRLRRTLLQVLELRQNTQPAGDIHTAPGERPVANGAATPDQVDIAALIRHELSPAVGWIRLAADREIADFGSSDTNEAVRKHRACHGRRVY